MHRLLPVASYQKVRSYSDYIDQDDQQKKDPSQSTTRRVPISFQKRTPGSFSVQHPQYIPANPTQPEIQLSGQFIPP